MLTGTRLRCPVAMSFPASGLEATYRNNLKDVAALLGQKHGEDNYMVFNVSGKSYDISRLNNMVLDFGWPDHLAPPLERLCSIVKSMGAWLKQDPKHCAVVHCKGGKGRTGVVICAYMSYIRWFARYGRGRCCSPHFSHRPTHPVV